MTPAGNSPVSYRLSDKTALFRQLADYQPCLLQAGEDEVQKSHGVSLSASAQAGDP
jgi:hypothetical protein